MNKLSFSLLICLLTVCVTLASFNRKKEPFILVDKTSSKASIVLKNTSSPEELYAAKELQRAIRLMTNVELAIETSEQKGGYSLIIGSPKDNPLVERNFFQTKNDEEIYIHRDGRRLFLAGASPRAALYAVYTFLQESLGARWYWPGDEGEYLPKHDSIKFEELTIRHTPSIRFRTLAINRIDPETDVWMARNRMNVNTYPPARLAETLAPARKEQGFLSRMASHNVTLPEELLNKHPEYVAEVKGRRYITPKVPPHLCWSNTGVEEAITKRIAEWWDERPDLDIIHFYPADHQSFCECKACLKMAPDVSTRWQKFSSNVIAKLEGTHPGKTYWTYAYQGYRPVPSSAPAKFDYIGYATYNASYRHLISRETKANKVLKKELAEWSAKGGNMGLRGYEFLTFKEPMFVPLLPWVVDQIKWMNGVGLNGYISEVDPFNFTPAIVGKKGRDALENRQWNTNRLALYAAARLLWDASLTAEEIRTEWSNRIFGSATGAMQEYYQAMEQAWMRDEASELGYFHHSVGALVDTFITPDLLAKADSCFKAAATSLASEPMSTQRARAIKQVQLEARMLEKWRKAYFFQQGKADVARRFACQAKTSPAVTGDENDAAWAQARFHPLQGLPKTDAHAAFLWDENELSIRITGLNTMDEYEGIQLDLGINPVVDAAVRLTFTKNGTLKLEESANGFDFTPHPHKEWPIRSAVNKEGGIIDLAIPLQPVLGKPIVGDEWRIALHLFSTGGATDNPFAKELLRFVKQPQHLVFFDNGERNTALNVTMQDRGWQTTRIKHEEKALRDALADDPSVILIRYDNASTLSAGFINNELDRYIRAGGVVIVSAQESFPFDRWFAPGSVRFVGEEVLRWGKLKGRQAASWQVAPNDLKRPFKEGRVPKAGLKVLDDGWEVFASIRSEAAGDIPYLLKKGSGAGVFILTTLPFGYAGGYAMFGDHHIPDVAMLVENLTALSRKAE